MTLEIDRKNNLVELQDLEISRPLGKKGRFLGWYIDGNWETKNDALTIANFEKISSILTNNLKITSSYIKLKINFKTQTKTEKEGLEKEQVGNEKDHSQNDVIAFLFSNEIYEITNFGKQNTNIDANGLALFLTHDKDK